MGGGPQTEGAAAPGWAHRLAPGPTPPGTRLIVLRRGLLLVVFPVCSWPGSMARDEEPVPPMTLGSMRRHGVRGLFVTCQHCGHERAVNTDDGPDDARRHPLARACVAAAAPS